MTGTLAGTAAGGLLVEVEGERLRISPEDVKGLIFFGRPVPVTRERVQRTGGGGVRGEVTIEGHAALHPAGRAVVIRTREGVWMVPLASLRRVASGEAANAPLFGVVV